MSVASDLRATLAATGLPIERETYTGTASTYMTFSLSSRPDLYASDVPTMERYTIYINLISPATTNTTALEAQIKSLLLEAGYDYPSTVDASTDPAVRMIVFQTETVVGV